MSDSILVRANIDLPPEVVKAVVQNAKLKYGKNEKGSYSIDTFEVLSRLITRFLEEKGFSEYVQNPDNYAD